jgi:hypothetical protein
MKVPPTTRSLLTMRFAIPAYWTPEQALAVFELLDDLREMIADHYGAQLFEEARRQYGLSEADRASDPSGEPEDTSF